MKTAPSNAVASNQILIPLWSLALVAASARTMAKLLISRTKVLMVVMGTSMMSLGYGPTRLCPR